MFTKILSISLLAFLFIGCNSSMQQTVTKKNESFPQWVLNPNSSNTLFYYASADGTNTTEAKNNALKQIASQISITLSSNTTTTKLTTTTTYKKNIKDTTNAVTHKINFTGVTIIDQAFVNGRFYSYVQVNKEILFQYLFKQMSITYNSILSLNKKINSNDIFYVFKESQNLDGKIETILEQLAILKSIKISFDDKVYLSKIAAIQENSKTKKSNAVVHIQTQNAEHEKVVFEKAFSAFGVKIANHIADVANKNNLIIISLDKKVQPYENRYKSQKMKDVFFADVHLKIVTYNSTKKTILAQNTINLRNASREGYEAAVVKTLKLEREIDQKGILNALLETL